MDDNDNVEAGAATMAASAARQFVLDQAALFTMYPSLKNNADTFSFLVFFFRCNTPFILSQ